MRRLIGLLALAACGDGVPAPDASVPVDAALGLVRVRYRGAILDGHPVFFQNGDGSLALATRTDGEGKANGYVMPGGSVTVVDTSAATQLLTTWMQVQPGDELIVDDPLLAGPRPITVIDLSIPIDPGAIFYQLQSSCGSQTVTDAAGSTMLVELGDCRGRADMLVYSISDSPSGEGPVYHYLYGEDVPVVAGGSVTLPGPFTPIDRADVEVTGVDGRVPNVVMRQRLVGERRNLFEDATEPFGFAFLSLHAGAGAASLDAMIPATATLLTEVTESVSNLVGVQHFARWDKNRTMIELDVAPRQLRRYTSRPHYDALAHAITWSEEPTGAVPDAVLATFGWTRPEIGGNYQWRVLAARGAEPRIALPVLPDGQYLQRATDLVIEPFLFTSIAADGGYDSFRAALPSQWPQRNGVTWPGEAVGDTPGFVVYQELSNKQFPD